MHRHEHFTSLLKRREFLGRGAIGGLALWSLLNAESEGATPDPLSVKKSHFPAKAKSIIYLHMIGAPSQLDLFENKPELVKRDGQGCPAELTKGKRFAFIGGN